MTTEYAPQSLQAAWDNHVAGFGEQNVETVLADYSEASTVTLFNHSTGAKQEFKGLDGVRKMFTDLFAKLTDLGSLAVPIIEVEEATETVFIIWHCPSSGVLSATDTFVFDSAHKIVRQTVVLTECARRPAGGHTSVQSVWDNHLAGFGAQDVPKILEDYTEDSVVSVFDHTTEKSEEHKGLAEIEKFFKGLFATLTDMSTLAVPLVNVSEETKSVFLIWKCPSSGFVSASDTVIVDDAFKITRQNVNLTTGPASAAAEEAK